MLVVYLLVFVLTLLSGSLNAISINKKIFATNGKIISTKRQANNDKINTIDSKLFERVTKLSGGSAVPAFNKQNEPKPISVLVTTSIGSPFLDKKKQLLMPRNSTIYEIKISLTQKFPGHPPVELQKLYFGSRLLTDNETISEITSLSPVPILLDMITGTGAYDKTLTVAQAIDAYVSTVVQQAYLGEKLKQESNSAAVDATTLVDGDGLNINDGEDEQYIEMDSLLYRQMYETVNESFYARYSDSIDAALEAERDPEVTSQDTAAWRDVSSKDVVMSPLKTRLAREFDLNVRGLKTFAWYSSVLLSYAYFGGADTDSKVLLLVSVPVLWLSKLRQLRLLSKVFTNMVLPLAVEWDFLMPFLPAPLQVIAQQSYRWFISENDTDTANLNQQDNENTLTAESVSDYIPSFLRTNTQWLQHRNILYEINNWRQSMTSFMSPLDIATRSVDRSTHKGSVRGREKRNQSDRKGSAKRKNKNRTKIDDKESKSVADSTHENVNDGQAAVETNLDKLVADDNSHSDSSDDDSDQFIENVRRLIASEIGDPEERAIALKGLESDEIRNMLSANKQSIDALLSGMTGLVGTELIGSEDDINEEDEEWNQRRRVEEIATSGGATSQQLYGLDGSEQQQLDNYDVENEDTQDMYTDDDLDTNTDSNSDMSEEEEEEDNDMYSSVPAPRDSDTAVSELLADTIDPDLSIVEDLDSIDEDDDDVVNDDNEVESDVVDDEEGSDEVSDVGGKQMDESEESNTVEDDENSEVDYDYYEEDDEEEVDEQQHLQDQGEQEQIDTEEDGEEGVDDNNTNNEYDDDDDDSDAAVTSEDNSVDDYEEIDLDNEQDDTSVDNDEVEYNSDNRYVADNGDDSNEDEEATSDDFIDSTLNESERDVDDHQDGSDDSKVDNKGEDFDNAIDNTAGDDDLEFDMDDSDIIDSSSSDVYHEKAVDDSMHSSTEDEGEEDVQFDVTESGADIGNSDVVDVEVQEGVEVVTASELDGVDVDIDNDNDIAESEDDEYEIEMSDLYNYYNDENEVEGGEKTELNEVVEEENSDKELLHGDNDAEKDV